MDKLVALLALLALVALQCTRSAGQEITADLVFFKKKARARDDAQVVVEHNSTQLLNVAAVEPGSRSNVLEKLAPATYWPANFYSSPKQDQFVYTPSEANYYFEFGFSPFSVFSGVHSTIQVFSNGYMTFDGSDNYYLREPPRTFEQYPFSYIAPFWSSAFTYDDESKVVYSMNRLNFGLDAKLNKSANRPLDHQVQEKLFKCVSDDVNRFLELKTPNLTAKFSAHVIILVNWLDLKLLGDQVSFQAAIASNYDTQQSYLLVNYNRTLLPTASFTQKPDSNKIKSLIGHKNLKKNYQYVNLFSNSIKSSVATDTKLAANEPINLFNEKGNTGRLGHYVFDISYKANDTCLNWFNLMQLSTNYTNRVQDAIRKNSFLRCPCTSVQAQSNSYFRLHHSQKDFSTTCYEMNFNVNKDILEKIANDEILYLAKQLCCYDASTGSLIKTNEKAGFVYIDNSPAEDIERFAGLRDECCSKDSIGTNNCNRFFTVHPINTCIGGIDLLSLPNFEAFLSPVPNKPSTVQKIRLSNGQAMLDPELLSRINAYKPPFVKFHNESLVLNWQRTLNESFELVVDIIDDQSTQNAKPNRTIELVVQNKRLVSRPINGTGPERSIVSVSSMAIPNFFKQLTTTGLTTTIKFNYLPVSNEIPIFGIMVTDNFLNLSTVETLSSIRVCDCNQKDKNAVCLTNRLLETIESNINSLACRCSRPYTGKYCDQIKDYCLVQPCSNAKCFTLSPELQLAQNRSFVCCKTELNENGTCLYKMERWSGFLPRTFFLFNNVNDDVKIVFDVFLPVIAFIFVLSLLFMVIFIVIEKRKLKLLSKARNKLMPFESANINFKTGSNATNSIDSYGDQNLIIKPAESSRKLVDYIGSSPLAKLNYNFGARAIRISKQQQQCTDVDEQNGADDCIITDTYRSNYNIGACNLNGTLQLSHTSSSSQLASRHCSDANSNTLPVVDAVCVGLKSASQQSVDPLASKASKTSEDKIFIKSLEDRAANCQRITITKPNSVIANSQKIYPNGMRTSAYCIIGQSNESSSFNETASASCQMDEYTQQDHGPRTKDAKKTIDVAIDTDDLSELGRKTSPKSPNNLSRNIFVLDPYQAPRLKIPRPKY